MTDDLRLSSLLLAVAIAIIAGEGEFAMAARSRLEASLAEEAAVAEIAVEAIEAEAEAIADAARDESEIECPVVAEGRFEEATILFTSAGPSVLFAVRLWQQRWCQFD